MRQKHGAKYHHFSKIIVSLKRKNLSKVMKFTEKQPSICIFLKLLLSSQDKRRPKFSQCTSFSNDVFFVYSVSIIAYVLMVLSIILARPH